MIKNFCPSLNHLRSSSTTMLSQLLSQMWVNSTWTVIYAYIFKNSFWCWSRSTVRNVMVIFFLLLSFVAGLLPLPMPQRDQHSQPKRAIQLMKLKRPKCDKFPFTKCDLWTSPKIYFMETKSFVEYLLNWTGEQSAGELHNRRSCLWVMWWWLKSYKSFSTKVRWWLWEIVAWKEFFMEQNS